VNEDAVFRGELRNTNQQLARAAHGETRREAISYTPVSRAVPALQQPKRLVDGGFCRFEQGRWHFGSGVHHAFAHDGAKPGLFYGLKSRSGVVTRFHRKSTSSSAANHLGNAESG